MEVAGCAAGPECVSITLDEHTLDAILAGLCSSPAQLVVTPIPDLFGWNNRVNVPGTIGDANWNWRLPFDLERSTEDPVCASAQSEFARSAKKPAGLPPNWQ